MEIGPTTPVLHNFEEKRNDSKKEAEIERTQSEQKPEWFGRYLGFLRKTSDFVEARGKLGFKYNDTNYSEEELETVEALANRILKILPLHPDFNLETARKFHEKLESILIPEYQNKVEQELGTKFDLDMVNLSPDYNPTGSDNKRTLELYVIIKAALNKIILFQENREILVPEVAIAITRLKYLGFTDRYFTPPRSIKKENILSLGIKA